MLVGDVCLMETCACGRCVLVGDVGGLVLEGDVCLWVTCACVGDVCLREMCACG